jgi:hypothetical protein
MLGVMGVYMLWCARALAAHALYAGAGGVCFKFGKNSSMPRVLGHSISDTTATLPYHGQLFLNYRLLRSTAECKLYYYILAFINL